MISTSNRECYNPGTNSALPPATSRCASSLPSRPFSPMHCLIIPCATSSGRSSIVRQVKLSLPGTHSSPGYWPGVWTMGNLVSRELPVHAGAFFEPAELSLSGSAQLALQESEEHARSGRFLSAASLGLLMLQMSILADDVFVGPRGLRCDHGRYVAIQLRRVSVRNREHPSWLTFLAATLVRFRTRRIRTRVSTRVRAGRMGIM